jgi:RND family efflux transporter MFP subunit
VGKLKSYLSKFKNLIFSHKKISIPLIVVLVVILFIMWPKSGNPILTENVKYQDVVKTVSVTGKVNAQNIANLTFQFGGKLVFLGAKEGDTVKKWQAIATLDQNQLQASFRQAQQDFIAAKAASEKYYDNHNDTESFDEKIQRTAIDASQNKAYDQIQKVQQDISNSTLYAPFDGILTKSGADSIGVNITPATIFTVTDPSLLDFEMDVDETDVGNVKAGQPINVVLDAFPTTTIKLTVGNIAFVSHTTTSGGNAFTVKGVIKDGSEYRVGMSGNADIVVSKREHVLTIPLSSVIDDNFVYVKTNNKFEKIKVKIGLQSDTLAEVLSGLSEGQSVAVDPSTVPQNLISK